MKVNVIRSYLIQWLGLFERSNEKLWGQVDINRFSLNKMGWGKDHQDFNIL